MKFYDCTIMYNKTNQTDDYHLVGKIIVKNNTLNIYSVRVAALAVLIFDNSYWKFKTPQLINGFQKTPEGFFDYYNLAFGNEYNRVYSDEFLKEKNVIKNDSKNKLIGIFNLNTMKYTIPDRTYRDGFKKESEIELQDALTYTN